MKYKRKSSLLLTYRQYEVPMNNLILDCSLSSNGLKGSKINAILTNLIMEGATLHHDTLVENTADSTSVAIINEIKLAWIPEVSECST